MQLFVQWSRRRPRGWEPAAASCWPSLPRRPDPTGLDLEPDDDPGWVCQLWVGGALLSGADHYAVEPDEGAGFRACAWNEDPVRYPEGRRWAREFMVGAGLSRWLMFAEEGAVLLHRDREALAPLRERGLIRPWAELRLPDPVLVRHGIMMSDALWQAHLSLAPPPA